MRKLSIVVPVYYNEESLPETVPTLLGLSRYLPGYEIELVFVDDGSGDRSLQMILDFQKQHPKNIVAVKLSRNFGSMSAILAGLGMSRGECIGVIAADLQDPPELFVEMVKIWESGTKSVFAVRTEREDPPLSRFFSSLYYLLVRTFALPGYPKGGFDFFLVDRQVVEDVLKIREKNTNLMSLIYWLGYNPVYIPYVRKKRKKGKSRWTLTKKVKLFVDTFVSFSFFPIRILSITGILSALASFLYGIIVFIMWVRGNITVQGWTAMMLMIAFTSGIQMSMIGILGEYVWRTLDETRHRPPFVIEKVFRENEG